MKSEKGMSHKMVLICIVVIAVLVASGAYYLNKRINSEKIQTYETNMLLIQGKAKVLSQESTVQKKEELLKGEKISDKVEEERVKEILDKQIISSDEEHFGKYYIWNNDVLNELGLTDVVLENGFYIVNYDTDEVICTEGIKVKNQTCYKLTQIVELQKEQEESKQNNNIGDQEQKTETEETKAE